jgi:hypothetical protein
MGDEEYELSYREALESIPAVDVGDPYTVNGKRYVFINGLPCCDAVVFERASKSRAKKTEALSHIAEPE